MANLHLDATEHGEKLIFLHTVQPGPANQSYGIQVAMLAGVPRVVITDARMKLKELEQSAVHVQPVVSEPKQADLFAVTTTHPVITELEALQPDQLSPREALEVLYALKGKL